MAQATERFPALWNAAAGKSFELFVPKVSAPAGGAGVVGESNTPLNTGKFVDGPGGVPAVVTPGPTASQRFGIFPNGGATALLRSVEALKKPKTSCVIESTMTGPGFVLGKVESGGRINSDEVMPLVGGDHAVSLVKAWKRISSLASS